jgi:hypothetical protein
MKIKNENHIKNQKGQTFLEFIFLLLVIVTISSTLMRGLGSFIGLRWESIVKVVATPNGNDVTMP